jgi:putative ABC transport system permease protein
VVGSRLPLETDRGRAALPVAAVFRDYASDAGTVMMSRRTYERLFDDRSFTALGVFAAPGIAAEALSAEIRGLAAQIGAELSIRPVSTLRRATLEVFDRTFTVTAVLRLLALVIAACGITGALLALELDRVRELGILRALGLARRQVAAMILAQSGALGLCAGLLAIPVGLLLSEILVHIINRRSFGWTIDIAWSFGVLAAAPVVGVAAGLLGGLYPARVMMKISPAEALREE